MIRTTSRLPADAMAEDRAFYKQLIAKPGLKDQP